MSDKVLVPVELLQKIVDALRIANDWNLDELNIEPPEEWGLELPEDCNGVMEGWCYTTDFANHIESLIEAEPEPASAEPVAILCRQTDESKTEWFDHDPLIPGSTRHKIRANHGGWELLPVYASQPARGCEPITKYVELTREQAFEHLKTNSFHLERTGLYKLVINPDWKPQPPQE